MNKIILSAPNSDWSNQFISIAEKIRQVVGKEAERIDHIGSTAVAELAAKDIIDIQITVSDISDIDFISKLQRAGFQYKPDTTRDSLVGVDCSSPELQKHYFQEKTGERKVHIHIREKDRLNQIYPLVFRDYLRADKVTRDAYLMIKKELAKRFSNDKESYYAIKDPHMDTIYQAAKLWAKLNNWMPDNKFK